MTIDVVQVRNNAYVARDTDTKGNVATRSTNSHSVSPLEFEMYRLEEVLHVFVAFMIDRGCAVAVSMYSFDCIADRISGGPIKNRSSCMSLDSGMINMTCIVVPF